MGRTGPESKHDERPESASHGDMDYEHRLETVKEETKPAGKTQKLPPYKNRKNMLSSKQERAERFFDLQDENKKLKEQIQDNETKLKMYPHIVTSR